MDSREKLEVTADARTIRFIVEHGGNVYVWADEASLEHVSTKPPDAQVSFDSLAGEGFTLHVDSSIVPPQKTWIIRLLRLPFRHLVVGRDPRWIPATPLDGAG